MILKPWTKKPDKKITPTSNDVIYYDLITNGTTVTCEFINSELPIRKPKLVITSNTIKK